MSVIPGSPDPEALPGTPGDDLINAFEGNDTIYGMGGNDTLYGGADDDFAYGDVGNDQIFGEGGNDTLQSGGDSDLLYGGAGNDHITVNDINYDGEGKGYGGDGDDVVALFGGSHGSAYGGDGIDTLLLASFGGPSIFVDLPAQTLDGHGAFPTAVFDGFEKLNLFSGSAFDSVRGGDYADTIMVGSGGDHVEAGGGDDRVGYTTRGAADLDGGEGRDTLVVTGGNSSIYFIYDSFDGGIDDGQGSTLTSFERFEAYGGNFDDIVGFSSGADIFFGSGGSDTAFGADGRDLLKGQAGADLLDGGGARDWLFGGGANDTLNGGDGNDVLGGGRGDDLMDGGAGDDRFRLGSGSDTVSGGAGHDSFEFLEPLSSLITLTDFETGGDHLRIKAEALPQGPSAGPLEPALLSLDLASGTQAQFVLSYDSGQDVTLLTWDSDGSTEGGATYAIARFFGQVVVEAADITLF